MTSSMSDSPFAHAAPVLAGQDRFGEARGLGVQWREGAFEPLQGMSPATTTPQAMPANAK